MKANLIKKPGARVPKRIFRQNEPAPVFPKLWNPRPPEAAEPDKAKDILLQCSRTKLWNPYPRPPEAAEPDEAKDILLQCSKRPVEARRKRHFI